MVHKVVYITQVMIKVSGIVFVKDAKKVEGA
jgi:hypothetical protein